MVYNYVASFLLMLYIMIIECGDIFYKNMFLVLSKYFNIKKS